VGGRKCLLHYIYWIEESPLHMKNDQFQRRKIHRQGQSVSFGVLQFTVISEYCTKPTKGTSDNSRDLDVVSLTTRMERYLELGFKPAEQLNSNPHANLKNTTTTP
jgi:hypothetical protein